MSGGGASPAIKKNGFINVSVGYYGGYSLFVVGGRCRLAVKKDEGGNITHYCYYTNQSSAEKFFYARDISNSYIDVREMVLKVAEIYGTFDIPFELRSKTISIGDVDINCDEDQIELQNVYSECGFVEGVARITTPVGDAACVVENGTLYPILTEYDQATEDNWTLQDVYLNGDNEVSNLQQMVDRSGNYLAYTEDQEADKWSPIENYLHMHVKMPIVPKIGYVPAQQVGLGNVLPGLNYAVTL